MKNSYGVVTIGAGSRGGKYSEAFQAIDNARLLSICDLMEERAAEKQNTYGYESHCLDYKEAIDRDDVNVVNVCTPAAMHPEVAIFAMERGKHVICEKPMALSLAEAERMVETAQQNKVTFALGFQYRNGLKYRKYKHLVENQLVGSPFMVVFNDIRAIRTVRGKPAMHDAVRGNGGPFTDMLCHMTDLMRWFTESEPVRVNANLFTYGINRPELTDIEYMVGNTRGEMKKIEKIAPDTGSATIEYASSDILSANLCWALPPDKKGGGAFDMIGPAGHMNNAKLDQVELPEPENKEDDLVLVVKDFLRAIEEGKRPQTNGEDGIAALATSLAVVKSSMEKRPVELKEIYAEKPALIDLLK